MKRIYSIIVSLFMLTIASAQTCDLPICVAFNASEAGDLPVAARRQISNKLHSLLTQNGVSGNSYYAPFALVPHVDVIDKHIVPGPPAKTVLNLSVTLELKEFNEGTILATYATDVDAVANNEQKALAEGVKRLGAKNSEIVAFFDQARKKIVSYYDRQAPQIISKAKALAATNQYDEALWHLMSVPECCQSYSQVVDVALQIYQSQINREGEMLLRKAEAVWAAGNNEDAARLAAEYLVQIDPQSAAFQKASTLLAEIKKKSAANAPWDFEMKKFDAAVSLQQQRINAAKAVGVAFANHQQPQNTTLILAK